MASALGLALVVVGGVVVGRAVLDASTDTAAVPSSGRSWYAGPPGAADRGPEDLDVEPAVLLEARPGTRDAGPVRPSRHPAVGEPRRVVVPSLGIDAPVIGIDTAGRELTPPSDAQVLGWWRAGAPPGAARGSALVTGHTLSSGGGAFDELETVGLGAAVRVRTDSGAIRYRVTAVTVYRKAGIARHAERLFSQQVPGRLVLVTCEDWNGSVYLSNAVVVAEPL